ncbi:MAG TPA: magnesium/cobalt transporter CorA, partial [Bacteroidota bacterium]
MPTAIQKRSKKAGLPPGSLVHVGERRTGDVECTVIDYSKGLIEESVQSLKGFVGKPPRKAVTRWINIEGLHEVGLLEKLGKEYRLHPLVLEDILQTGQRPKLEDLEDDLFIVLRMLRYKPELQLVEEEQVSIILGEQFVLSFQEGLQGDVFDPVRERLRNNKGTLRSLGSDYLVYTLMDAMVDQYFVILEAITERMEEVEKKLLENPTKQALEELYRLKRQLLSMRKAVWPLREVVARLERREFRLIRKQTQLYLRDLYDHTIEVIETIENLRETLASMIDLYISSISNRMNEIMKVLTIIATIF